MMNQLHAVAPKDLHRLDVDLMVNMKKLESLATVAIENGKKTELLVRDVEEACGDWKKILGSTSYRASKCPTILDVLHQSEQVGSSLDATLKSKAKEKAKKVKESFAGRWKKEKTKISRRKKGKGKEKSAQSPETYVVPTTPVGSSFDEDAKTLVADDDDAAQFIEKNKGEVFEDADDCGAALRAAANIQSIISLVTQALDEVESTGNFIRDAFDAVSLDTASIIANIEDRMGARDDPKAIYRLGEEIRAVLASLDILESFFEETMDLVHTGRALVNSYQVISERQKQMRNQLIVQ